ncbi:MAG: DUF4440 domain-containing protein [Gemmatimonadota bacterium]
MPSALDDVRAEYTAYFDAFQALDPEAVVEFCHLPCAAISSQGVMVCASSDEVRGFFGWMMTALRARGFVRSVPESTSARQLSEDVAILSTRVLRFKADGSELERFGATYTFRRTGDGWKIAVLTIHDADTVLSLA